MAAPLNYTRHEQDWDDIDSLALILGVAAGYRPGDVGLALGKTRHAAKARMQRIRALDRRLTQQAETLQRNTSNRG